MPTLMDSRQVVNRAALATIGSSVNTTLDSLFSQIDSVIVTKAGTQTITGVKTFGASAITTPVLIIRDANAGDSTNTVQLLVGNSGASQGSIFLQYTNAAATGSPVGRLSFQPRNNANSSATNPANITFTKTAGADTAVIDIANTVGRIYLKENGQVGIGTNTPGAGLDVANTSTSNAATLRVNAQLNGSGPGLKIVSATRSVTESVLEVDSASVVGSLTMLGSGKVGIGTNSPSQMLDVVNNQNADTRVRIGNNSAGNAASLIFFLGGDAANTYLYHQNSGFATTGPFRANGGTLRNDSAGLDILAGGGSGDIKFWTGGNNQRAILTSAGDLGLGTTSPVNSAGAATLTIAGSTGGQIAFQNGVTAKGYIYNNATNLLISSAVTNSILFMRDTGTNESGRWDPSGRLLIGNTATRANTASSGSSLQIESGGSAASASIYRATNDTAPPALVLGKTRATTIGGVTTVAAGDNTGALHFEGTDGTSSVRSASILGIVEGAVSTGVVPGVLAFFTCNSSGTNTERMRIDSTGAVIIGGTVAGAKFDVQNGNARVVNTDGGSTFIFSESHGTGTAPFFAGRMSRGTLASPTATQNNDTLMELVGIGYGTSAYGPASSYIAITASENWTNSANGSYMSFATVSQGTVVQSERMRILTNGGVAIGTTSLGTGSTLTVAGNTSVTNNQFYGLQDTSNNPGGRFGIDTSNNVYLGNFNTGGILTLQVASGGDIRSFQAAVELSRLNAIGLGIGLSPATRLDVQAVTTVGSSFGLRVAGGTNASDYAARFNNATGTALWQVDGTGLMQLFGSTTGNVGIRASASTTTYALTMPAAQGAAETTLVNDGTGILTWRQGSGSGTKNYLGTVNAVNGNGNFELGTTTKWSLAHSSLSNTFPSTVGTAGNSFSSAGGAHGGSAASGNLSISAISSGQLAGSYSLSYVSSAATTAGDMLISDAFTIDLEDQAKVMTIKVYYKAQTNPANGNFSGTSSNSFGIAIYDVTNAAWIQPSGVFNIVQNSGVGYMTGTFQTTSNSTQYQIAFYNANASGGAITMYLDDFFIGPQTAPVGPAVSDWTAFTPTGSFTTNSTYTGFYRRVGDEMEVVAKVAFSGAPNSVSCYINLPSGYTLDTSKIVDSGNFNTNVGMGALFGGTYNLEVLSYTSTQVAVAYQSTNAGLMTQVTQSLPISLANGNAITVWFKVPIVGWSSSVSMSNDTDTRVVAAAYYMSTNTTPGSGNQINFDTKLYDTHGSVTTGTNAWKFTAPVTGYYNVHSFTNLNNATSSNISLYLNGTIKFGLYNQGTAGVGNANVTVFMNAGDFVDVRPDAGSQFVGTQTSSHIHIERVSGPAVIAATESVAATYTVDGGGQSLTSASVAIQFNTKTFDSHSAVTTGSSWQFKAPISGKYHVSWQVFSATNSSGNFQLQLVKNGSVVVGRANTYATMAGGSSVVANQATAAQAVDVQLNAGDVLSVSIGMAASVGSVYTATTDSWFSIFRIGN